MATDSIELRPNCIGCGKPILRPSDAEPTLTRSGILIHNREDCAEKAVESFQKRGILIG